MTSVERVPVLPAAAPLNQVDFHELYRRAAVLAKTQLVPEALRGRPEDIVLVGLYGAERGIPLATAIQEIHIIEGRPSPSAQLRLGLIRRAGHEARFVTSTAEKAVIRGRRHEYSGDPEGWVELEYTIEDARRAGLLNVWIERWVKNSEGRNRKLTLTVGDDRGTELAPDAPEWAQEEFAAGAFRHKDNWHKYPADMLRARAASALSRMEFSDVMLALGVDAYTAEEKGFDVGQDLDDARPAAETPADVEDELIDDADVVEEEPGSDTFASATPAATDDNDPVRGVPGKETASDPSAPSPSPPETDGAPRTAVAALRTKFGKLPPKHKAHMFRWMGEHKVPNDETATDDQVDATVAEIDRLTAAGA